MRLWQLCSLRDQGHRRLWRPLQSFQVTRTALSPRILTCSLFSPLLMPDAASQCTKNFGMVSAERHEDCQCISPFLEWGSYHVHPQREDASVSQQHRSRCLQSMSFLLHSQQQWPRGLVRLQRVPGQPRRSWQLPPIPAGGCRGRWGHCPVVAGHMPAHPSRCGVTGR